MINLDHLGPLTAETVELAIQIADDDARAAVECHCGRVDLDDNRQWWDTPITTPPTTSSTRRSATSTSAS